MLALLIQRRSDNFSSVHRWRPSDKVLPIICSIFLISYLQRGSAILCLKMVFISPAANKLYSSSTLKFIHHTPLTTCCLSPSLFFLLYRPLSSISFSFSSFSFPLFFLSYFIFPSLIYFFFYKSRWCEPRVFIPSLGAQGKKSTLLRCATREPSSGRQLS